ncbi:MAG: hypothetical protein E7393_04810 [Ruminococcaceae bacterium]|nr:hypothetical protein [Oscillospiraceae bacterium]
MFNFSEWLKAGIIDGYKKGHTPFVKVTEMTAAYLSKGFITESQVEEIVTACPAPVEEEPAEEFAEA